MVLIATYERTALASVIFTGNEKLGEEREREREIAKLSCAVWISRSRKFSRRVVLESAKIIPLLSSIARSRLDASRNSYKSNRAESQFHSPSFEDN